MVLLYAGAKSQASNVGTERINMTDLQWQELVEKTRQGDKNAFASLYKETRRSVYFTALSLLANEENAKDVMQDTFIAAIEKLPDLKDAAKFPKWVNSIAVNKCRRYFRAHSEDSVDEMTEQGIDISDDSFIPDNYVDDEIRRKVMMNIIKNELSDAQRQTIIMYYYNEMSLQDIAEAMDCPLKTVSSRLVSAREKIRKAVITYEKKNDDRLHAALPVSVLTLILRKEAESQSVPDIPLTLFSKTLTDAAAKASASTAMKGTVAGGKIMTGAIKAKILAGVAAVLIAGGAITGVAIYQNKDTQKKHLTRRAEETKESSVEVVSDEKEDEKLVGNTTSEMTDLAAETSETALPEFPKLTHDSEETINSARANSESVLLKFGFKDPYMYGDPSEGDVPVKVFGNIYYFAGESGNYTDEEVKNEVIAALKDSLDYFSSESVYTDDLLSHCIEMEQWVQAVLANDKQIYIDRIEFASVSRYEAPASEDSKVDEDLVGTWSVDQDGQYGEITFNADGTGLAVMFTDQTHSTVVDSLEFNWYVENGKLSLPAVDPTLSDPIVSYSIEGDKLIIGNEDLTLEYTKKAE